MEEDEEEEKVGDEEGEFIYIREWRENEQKWCGREGEAIVEGVEGGGGGRGGGGGGGGKGGGGGGGGEEEEEVVRAEEEGEEKEEEEEAGGKEG